MARTEIKWHRNPGFLEDAAEDVNNDGIVTVLDLILIGQYFGLTPPPPHVDVNEDGQVDIKDLLLVAAIMDRTPAAPGLVSEIPLSVSVVQGWLRLARSGLDGSTAHRRGLSVLERLAGSMSPTVRTTWSEVKRSLWK